MGGEGDVEVEPGTGPPTAAVENEATLARAAVEEERARMEAMEDGAEKDEALEKLAQMEAAAVEAEVIVAARPVLQSCEFAA